MQRYVTDTGVKEWFVQFQDVTSSKRADDIAGLLIQFLEETGCLEKVGAQFYDGAPRDSRGLKAERMQDLFLPTSMALLHFFLGHLSAPNYWTKYANNVSHGWHQHAGSTHPE